ncbi:sensor domain-containing diguanylate cyclase [Rhizobium sp. BE258]|jgi:diguanylate cyclase (GGDEF)-like protein|uniref:sensor domain-containing diguanylate cyclase n=1 Tax=Rhizobium sp. BE258 TaxID=2817722 RepID=UPI00285D5987|nr:sensor domain-containing diguanylate cyclase [Rhizobium sp. BE258]MDR7143442.1 diguanylate cyclase (GGDEF)-like protein [Rhizobium sp. BE258]
MGQVVRLPANEAERLLAVRALNAASRSPTPELAALAELARGVFGTPFAAINIIDEDWQRIAGQAGMQLAECSRDLSICTRVVYANDLVIVPDLQRHPELSRMPYVEGHPHFRFYAGAPIETDDSLAVGAFCILDTRPRDLSEVEIDSLRRFALVASALLRLQKANMIMGLAETSLRVAAMTDPLTGFYNRSALAALVDGELDRSLAAGQTFGALYLDMDGFKGINDRLGHHAGDEVLREAANRIRAVVRAGDIAVRMGGDEFALFVPNPPNAAALSSVADRLVAAFRQPFEVEGQTVSARLSIGGALAPQAGTNRIDLLKVVDTALYQAKAAGRDRYLIAGI